MHSATMTTTASPCRFPTVALSWAATLLRECDLEHHGVDLFGRDSFLLGRLLITLGMLCMACAAQEPLCTLLSSCCVQLRLGTAAGEGGVRCMYGEKHFVV